MRKAIRVNKKQLLDCVAHWTETSQIPGKLPRLKDDQYLFPDGSAHDLTDNFSRHHSVSRCYMGQWDARYPKIADKSRLDTYEAFNKLLMKNKKAAIELTAIDMEPGEMVADFLDRTGAIRVAKADDMEDGENAFQISAVTPPTDKQLKVLEKHCKSVYKPCYFEFTVYSDKLEKTKEIWGTTNEREDGRRTPVEKEMCDGYGMTQVLYGSDVSLQEFTRASNWVKKRCRI